MTLGGRAQAALDEMGTIIDDGWRALRLDVRDAASQARQFTVLGRGWAAALASEAALKLRETAQASTEA